MPSLPIRFLLRCFALILVVTTRWPLPCRADDRAPPENATLIKGTSFNPRSGPPGTTLFTTLPAEKTGIVTENHYADPAMWGDRYAEFAYGSIGSGIAIGDYDGDGLPDIFVVNKSDPCRLYRNRGGMHFEDVTQRAGLERADTAWVQGAAFADVNNDGRLDLYICRFGATNLLYINQGDGTFLERGKEAGLDLVDASVMASFCDYDRDGWLDVYVQTNLLDNQRHPDGQRDHLFHNRGDGTFEDVTNHAGIYGETQGHSATWWDFNNDGWPDLYVANDFATPDQLYRNNRDGTFTNVLSKIVPHIPHFSMGADIGDVNNDGLIDLFVADMAPTHRDENVRGMLNMRALMARDLPLAEAAPQSMQNALFLNTGKDRCQEAAVLAGLDKTDWTWSVRFEDLDEDGRIDLHVTNGMIRDFFDADLLARFTNADFDQRKRLVKAAPALPEHNFAFRNLGDLQFQDRSTDWGLNHDGISFGAAFADLDGDGDLDLIFVNYQGKPTVCRNDSVGSHHVIFSLKGTASNRFGIGAIIKLESRSGQQVRQLSSARGYLSTSEPIVHFGLGADETISRLTVDWSSGRRQVFTDLPADQRYEIIEPPKAVDGSNDVAVKSISPQFTEISEQCGLAIPAPEPTTDELAIQRLLPFRHQRFGPGVAVGDLDGDGMDDVCLGGVTGTPLQVLLNVGSGHFSPGGSPVLAHSGAVADGVPLIFDADNDGVPDLFVVKGGVNLPAENAGYQPRLYLGRGAGIFREAPPDSLPSLPISSGAAAAADFNRDGQMDIFVGGRVVPGAYPRAPRSTLLVNSNGRFTDATEQLAPDLEKVGMVTSALWTDVDRDGWLDLLVTTEWGSVRCWHNDHGKHFDDWSERLGFLAAGTGWWNSIATADFNGDGKLDYAVGNVGLNTRYHARPEKPALLFLGDFGGAGSLQTIEAEYDGDRHVPLRGRSQIGSVIPAVLKKFPTFAAYAAATIEDIFSIDQLAAASVFSATELRSGVFLSQPNGTFRFSPLPREAQIAPIFGLVAGDFDGDGKADLYGVQNSYAPIPETGRFDGGLSQLLLGDGRGSFKIESIRDSGLIVPGDAKALVLCDLDGNGWPDFLVTRNNSTPLVFRNEGVPGRHSTEIIIKTAEKTSAVGSQMTLVMKNGATQMAEIHCGEGYLSQSVLSPFFGYTDDNPPRELQVRWPDGSVSTEKWDIKNSATWIVAQRKQE